MISFGIWMTTPPPPPPQTWDELIVFAKVWVRGKPNYRLSVCEPLPPQNLPPFILPTHISGWFLFVCVFVFLTLFWRGGDIFKLIGSCLSHVPFLFRWLLPCDSGIGGSHPQVSLGFSSGNERANLSAQALESTGLFCDPNFKCANADLIKPAEWVAHGMLL